MRRDLVLGFKGREGLNRVLAAPGVMSSRLNALDAWIFAGAPYCEARPEALSALQPLHIDPLEQ